MADPAPTPIDDEPHSGIIGLEELTGNNPRTRFRSLLRLIFAIMLFGLLLGEVVLYSFFKTVESRVESQDRRIERMQSVLTDFLASRDNAGKIQEIEQQVDRTAEAVGELSNLVQDQAPPDPTEN